MADFVDAGFAVVLAELNLDPVFTLACRFASDDYCAIQPSATIFGDGRIGVVAFNPSHPTLNGVSTFSGGTSSDRPNGTLLHSASSLIASWNDGVDRPRVATRIVEGTRRVDLGFFSPTSDVRSGFVDASSDAMRKVANALRWAGREIQEPAGRHAFVGRLRRDG